ncbi:GspH/FimT family pseudopilin [Ramlibacter solisilvae]|uniref:Type II secretion system protein H n=1 Tax=Ramlibacter tataouinensis TaxID=94132 RepID=A0A127JXN9_9BURK|nr:GspH/FimT family pseudopilin [Ramlibacter tataouinensis]AMO24623.1 hypothetical protein UC35_19515 [Ramlibacter tataouinensis]
MSARARSRGFTLIELMVTVTIVAVMLGLAVPAFRSFVANQKVKTATYDLMTAVMMARSEAIKRNSTVSLTPTSTTAWASGWSVMAGTSTIHTLQPMDSVTVTQKDTSNTATTPAAVSFGASGRPAAGVWFEVTGIADAVKCVKVDASGVPASTNRSCQ